ncbi:hypothetical protein [Imtechella halotolerans]|uniref:Uncharacterized protein n=1 Tax=Imtechella halotolerans K1 TaxID=946077 RepID=I0WHK7_9FLAO|nr:hypothetical protein [Imtechella halotolerans]EID75873.1 hypothetical protein W5A_02984 [Imtechella halotolerans K1]WMQ63062.1 hypothetical protein PT603_12075 [Imtechella halotolerans]
MKYVYLVLGILAVVLMIFNSTQIDTNAPFKGDSLVAIIGIVAPLCAILLLLIMHLSQKIQQKLKD